MVRPVQSDNEPFPTASSVEVECEEGSGQIGDAGGGAVESAQQSPCLEDRGSSFAHPTDASAGAVDRLLSGREVVHLPR